MSGYKPDRRGIGEVLRSPEMQAHMRERAEKAKTYAAAMSPIGREGDPHPGLYRDSWEVDSGVRDEPSRRAYGRVSNPVDYAASLEWGNERMDGQYVLTRAIDAMRD